MFCVKNATVGSLLLISWTDKMYFNRNSTDSLFFFNVYLSTQLKVSIKQYNYKWNLFTSYEGVRVKIPSLVEIGMRPHHVTRGYKICYLLTLGSIQEWRGEIVHVTNPGRHGGTPLYTHVCSRQWCGRQYRVGNGIAYSGFAHPVNVHC